MTDVRCNYTEREYDPSRYEWKFRIMDQLAESAKFREENQYASGWNCPQATQDYIDIGNNKTNLRRKRVAVEKDGETIIYENSDIVCQKYNLIITTITTQISRKKRYEKDGLVIYYFDKPKPKTSQYVGISFNNRYKKWVAKISIDRKQKHIGQYNTEEEAYQARQDFIKRRCLA